MELKFLGTGGGRYVTGEQKRRTAGIIVTTDQTRLHVDPGPGALVYTNKELDNPLETDAVLVSHDHIDHCNDAEAIIEMITEVGKKPASLFASESVLEGYGDHEKHVSDYHQDLCSRVERLEEGAEFEFEDLSIRSQQMFHSDPKTQGFVLTDNKNSIGFWTDTEYSEELVDLYKGCDIMVFYCGRPKGKSIPSHTALDDLPKVIEEVKPKTVIVTHFGYAFLDEDLDEQKKWLEEEVDSKVIFAEDGMNFPGNRSLKSF